jgi:hypothetical protein
MTDKATDITGATDATARRCAPITLAAAGPQRCCQTNEPKHQCLVDGYFYEITKERHSVRAASRFSLNVLRFESDLCELNRL